MIPSVDIRKVDGQTGVVRPGSEGILCIIAPSEKGTANQAASYTRSDLAQSDFGGGALVDYAAYVMSVAQNPVLLVRPTTATAATYGTVTLTGQGTAPITMVASSAPLDDYDVLVTFVDGGTVGAAGITYTESLDAGKTTGPLKALGTLKTIQIPSSGVSLAIGDGTILPGETVACRTTGARMSNTDLVAALEALRVTASPWDSVLVHGEATATTVATLDLWLASREAEGKYHTAITNARLRNTGETEASYKGVLQGLFGQAASIRVVVGADGGDVVSVVRGITMRRPTALGLAARGMAIDLATDAAYVSDGPIQGYQISDARNNPIYHDEALFPGLDDLRLATFRSFFGREGVYITNPLLISP